MTKNPYITFIIAYIVNIKTPKRNDSIIIFLEKLYRFPIKSKPGPSLVKSDCIAEIYRLISPHLTIKVLIIEITNDIHDNISNQIEFPEEIFL